MGANLFKNTSGSCLGQIAQDELDCLGIDYSSTKCTSESVAPCGQDFESLLGLYPVFDLTLPTNGNGFVFEFQDKALFIEDDGFSVTLRKSRMGITTLALAILPENWDFVCNLKLDTKYEPRTLEELVDNYKPYFPEFYAKTWSDFELSWSTLGYKWSNASYKKDFLYRTGDSFIVLGPCEDTVCLYLVVEDFGVTDDNINKFSSFAQNPDHWRKVFCVSTGLNKCQGYQRKKQPESFYEVVEIGTYHSVEFPIRYSPPRPLLNN